MLRISHTCCRFQAFGSVTSHLTPRWRITPVLHASYHNARQILLLTETYGNIDVDEFRSLAWEPQVPVHLRDFHHLPAMKTWFASPDKEKASVSLSDKLSSSSFAKVSYELIISSSSDLESTSACSMTCLQAFQTWLRNQPAEKEYNDALCTLIDNLLATAIEGKARFLPFEAPLLLFLQALRYNQSTNDPSKGIKQLYIAQSDIHHLPSSLTEDLPAPEVVTHAGKGDIYASSIWLGLQPTYTPLHRDPNPNVFCQLAGSKAVRLMRPRAGLAVFREVQRRLDGGASDRFRGAEMMHGRERQELHRAVWVDDDETDIRSKETETWQAILDPGDALFIPQGWWHSVRSVGPETELNASANWWFR